ncbi:lytic transglycosylase [Nocardioides jiangxiensis]|uniref:Transglycosylase SLT domain-containing protein n=1 Tax=Nocardioides jiangxiensis TaxID=3064524 RepID=A0ABT9B396_9ACTN|nr:transglycosylase SLT domain-containing protein [Nocardioides sp. WY-20]MDO7869322.1 transglycosylase SLT domain-containing protein [Nocardioides sp. WY-20]
MTATRTIHRLLTGLLATALTGATLALAAPAEARHADLPQGRTYTKHTVRAGETATELAVRYHAWTDELIRYNHLGQDGQLYVGQHIVIPQVTARLHHAPKKASHRPTSRQPKATRKTWRHADPSRGQVRSEIIRTARAHGVDPELALAISWQESGWQMHHVSWASAIGAMQVLPSTGTWMSMYADRPLRLTRLHDNVLAGVLLLKVLDQGTHTSRGQIAAYYQGLGAVREHGLYADTERYVANVKYLKKRLEHGWRPA